MVSEYFNVNTIIDIDISPTGIRSSKPTFFSLELNFYQRNSNKLYPLVKPKNAKIKDLKPIITTIANEILNLELFVNNQHFDYRLTKKDQEIELV